MVLRLDSQLYSFRSAPTRLLPWLQHRYSITKKLKKITGHAAIQVLNQSWSMPKWWEKHVLNFSLELLFQREILMFSQQTACWYARTLIPYSTYRNYFSVFAKLNEQPLGELIFNNPAIKRDFLFYYAINKQCLEYYWLPHSVVEDVPWYWLRLSKYNFLDLAFSREKKDGPASVYFFLVEIFLPGLSRIIN